GIDYSGATDSTVAIQAIIDANPGRTIQMGVGVLEVSSLVLDKGQHLKGVGWQDWRDRFVFFGDSDWLDDAIFNGTVIRSTATSGNAVTVHDSEVNTGALSDFILIVAGFGTSVGIRIGGGGVLETVVHLVWRNIKVGNFASGVVMENVN